MWTECKFVWILGGGGDFDITAILWDPCEQQFMFSDRWFSVEGDIIYYI